ncbi:MAG TPA: DUF4265 domain-containing protein [Reyranella sp.]|nr:DUF4265 domain-containing protein [Reyranella sp.]
MTHNYAKIRFFVDPEDGHRESAELLWAEPVGSKEGGAFRLMNSPYYSRAASYLDIVRAKEAPDGLGLDYAGTIQTSGHSTLWIYTHKNSSHFKPRWAPLQSLGCTYEGAYVDTPNGERTLYSVDVPPETNFDEVMSILDDGQRDGVWQFMIGHIGRASPLASGDA